MNQTIYRHRRRHRSRHFPGSPLLSMLFFPACILYHELLLRAFDRDAPFFSLGLVRIVFFSGAAGLLLFLLTDVIPWRTAARVLGGAALALGTVIVCIQRGCRSMFGLYFGVGVMGNMAGDVTGGFASTVWSVVLGILPFILLALVPLGVYIRFGRSIIVAGQRSAGERLVAAGGLALFQLIGVVLCVAFNQEGYYTYNFSSNLGVPQYGLVTSIRLELQYQLFGLPKAPLDELLPAPSPEASSTPSPGEEDTAGEEPSPQPSQGPQVLDIDFDQLMADTQDETLLGMHKYFSSKTPTQTNQYTGMFRGKNLILITAEAFSPYLISQELTPTLYRLTHEGFVFENFYQPDWTQSTAGGEFSVTTGIIPNWINGSFATIASLDKYMPFTLAHQFAALGYKVPAWHNHSYTYYQRNQYLGNFGYDYKGVGNGLELKGDCWPQSDLEMMELTVDSYIDDYVEHGQNFHAYYMTVSGHGKYSWADNAMSEKNRAVVEAMFPDASEPVQAYLACNLELEYAMAYLVEKLEAAGIADDTLIVMAPDHYPYLLTQGQPRDYYVELSGVEDSEALTSRYRNTLVMWSAAITQPIVVDTPCSSVDIVPTISNLFGLAYDARLYSGRDIFATNYAVDQVSSCMPLVVFANNKGQGNSWITAAGTYEASTGTFTPREGVSVGEDYVSQVKRLVNSKVQFSKLLVAEDYYRILFG